MSKSTQARNLTAGDFIKMRNRTERVESVTLTPPKCKRGEGPQWFDTVQLVTDRHVYRLAGSHFVKLIEGN